MDVYAKRRLGLVVFLFASAFTVALMCSGIYVYQFGILAGIGLMVAGLALILTPPETFIKHRDTCVGVSLWQQANAKAR